MRQARRWWAAALVSLAAFGVAVWVSGAFVLPHWLTLGADRWAVAAGVGAAAAGLAGLWGQSFATRTGGDTPGGGDHRPITVAGANPGIISVGDSAVNVQVQAQAATVLPPEALAAPVDVPAPRGLANLPDAAGMFVGRAADLGRLEKALSGGGDVAVHGLGGIGKSTLAARYAATHRRDYSVIWWITADSPAGIDTGLAGLAVALQPALTGLLPLEALRERALAWLASHSGWLVVLDNVTDPGHVQALLGRAPAGRFVITSRRATGWHGIAAPLPLDVLDSVEARQLLVGILSYGRDLRSGRLEGAEALCTELGHLPLAIEQAGAYIAETGITPTEYLRLLAAYPADMYAQTAAGGDDLRTIARIWRVTLDQLAATPVAGQLLRVLAFYAPAGIPRPLLDGLTEPQQLATAIGRLAAYSMITIGGDGTLAVHRLVQAVTRTPEPADPSRTPAPIEKAREQATGAVSWLPTAIGAGAGRCCPGGGPARPGTRPRSRSPTCRAPGPPRPGTDTPGRPTAAAGPALSRLPRRTPRGW